MPPEKCAVSSKCVSCTIHIVSYHVFRSYLWYHLKELTRQNYYKDKIICISKIACYVVRVTYYGWCAWVFFLQGDRQPSITSTAILEEPDLPSFVSLSIDKSIYVSGFCLSFLCPPFLISCFPSIMEREEYEGEIQTCLTNQIIIIT